MAKFYSSKESREIRSRKFHSIHSFNFQYLTVLVGPREENLRKPSRSRENCRIKLSGFLPDHLLQLPLATRLRNSSKSTVYRLVKTHIWLPLDT